MKEILVELSVALDKLKIHTLSDILRTYKEGKEVDVVDQLITFNVNFDDNEEEQDKKVVNWIKIKSHRFPTSCLYSIAKEDNYNYSKYTSEHSIVVNRGIETKNTVIKDVIIDFDSEEERDKEFQIIETKLYPLGIRFL